MTHGGAAQPLGFFFPCQGDGERRQECNYGIRSKNRHDTTEVVWGGTRKATTPFSPVETAAAKLLVGRRRDFFSAAPGRQFPAAPVRQ